jgi:hypothetical protein
MRLSPLSERRVTARLARHLQVDYRTDADWRRATTMDVSVHGCRLRVGEDLARGSRVHVRFTRVEGESSVAAVVEGVVVWIRLEGLSYQAGIHFPTGDPALSALISALDVSAPD